MDGHIASETFLGEPKSLSAVRRFVSHHFPHPMNSHLALLADELASRAIEAGPAFRMDLSIDRGEVAIEISIHSADEDVRPEPTVLSKNVIDGLSTYCHLATSNGTTLVWARAPVKMENND